MAKMICRRNLQRRAWRRLVRWKEECKIGCGVKETLDDIVGHIEWTTVHDGARTFRVYLRKLWAIKVWHQQAQITLGKKRRLEEIRTGWKSTQAAHAIIRWSRRRVLLPRRITRFSLVIKLRPSYMLLRTRRSLKSFVRKWRASRLRRTLLRVIARQDLMSQMREQRAQRDEHLQRHFEKKRLFVRIKAARRLQAWWRCCMQFLPGSTTDNLRLEVMHVMRMQREVAIRLQAKWRGRQYRRATAALKIQRVVRGYIAR